MTDRAKLRELLAEATSPNRKYRAGVINAKIDDDLIAAARNALPELLDELDRAERERERAAEHSRVELLRDKLSDCESALRAQNDLALERLERIGRLEEALEACERLAVDATDCTDPIVYEKDWCSDSPSESYRTLHVLLDRIRKRARSALSSPAPETAPASGTTCHYCSGWVDHPSVHERCIRSERCVGMPGYTGDARPSCSTPQPSPAAPQTQGDAPETKDKE